MARGARYRLLLVDRYSRNQHNSISYLSSTMARFTITIYVALAAAFAVTHAVLVSARVERALSQRSSSSSSSSSSSFEPAMSAATEEPESTAAAPPQHHDAAGQEPASNSIATGTEAGTMPAVSQPTKKGASKILCRRQHPFSSYCTFCEGRSRAPFLHTLSMLLIAHSVCLHTNFLTHARLCFLLFRVVFCNTFLS